jgi:glycogen(starch) synthase
MPDAIHLHTAMVWWVVDYIRRHISIPLVYTLHSVDIAEYEIGNEPSHILTHNDEQAIAIQNADRVICISKNEAELVYHYYPHANHKVSIIGNGIENIQFVRKKDRYFSDPVSILYSGRLVMRKGIFDLMEAMPGVIKKYPDTKFIFAGGLLI